MARSDVKIRGLDDPRMAESSPSLARSSMLGALRDRVGTAAIQRRMLARKAAAHVAAADPASTAERGFSGPARELPYRAEIESSYGVDLGGVRAYTGAAAASAASSLEAEAYAVGNQVAFASDTPDKHVVAHEAAHVVQQAHGVHLSSAVSSPGDGYEEQADAAADRAVRGETARDLLPATEVGAARGGPVQRYHLHRGARVADDGEMAVLQESMIGGNTAWASPARIEESAAKLAAATSKITLKPGATRITAPDDKGTTHELVDIVPVNLRNKTEDTELQLWADCGRAARTVSGMDGGTGSGNSVASVQYQKGGRDTRGDASLPMEIQKVKMFLDLLSDKNLHLKFKQPRYDIGARLQVIRAKLDKWSRTADEAARETDGKRYTALRGKMQREQTEMEDRVRAEYEQLTDESRLVFDKKAGINRFADPDIGEAFYISSGGKPHPGLEAGRGTWNFHWGGVVMKSGRDTMTMEGYAVGDYNAENNDWAFQMYGVGIEGQSFHDEHKDVHKQHGDAPTTMVAARPKG